MTQKHALRRRILERLRRQPLGLRLARSQTILRRLRRSKLYRHARWMLCYVAVDGEVETRVLLRQALADGKRLAVPVTWRRHLWACEIHDPHRDLRVKGPFGIPHPADPHLRRVAPGELDLILVPGVAFDRSGRRLGRGGGYFDRFLKTVPARIPRVGLAFRFQLVREIPWEPHDQPVGWVVTEERTFLSRTLHSGKR